MRQELDDSLCRRYPKIFATRHRDPAKTCMTWGLECGDGWFDLIDRLRVAGRPRTRSLMRALDWGRV